MSQVDDKILSIEQDCLELRLADQSFYKESVKEIRRKNRGKIFLSLTLCLGVALSGGILFCQLIHCRILS